MTERPNLDYKERLQQEDVYRTDVVHNFHAVIGAYMNSVVLDFQFPERTDISGVHIYRSFDSDQDGFELVTPHPIGCTRWVDSPKLSWKEQIHPVQVRKVDLPEPTLQFQLPEAIYAPVGLTKLGYRYQGEPQPLTTKLPFQMAERFVRLKFGGQEIGWGELDCDNVTFVLPLSKIPDDLVERFIRTPDSVNPTDWEFSYYTLKDNPPLQRVFYRAVLVARAGFEVTPLLKSPLAFVEGEKISWIWRSALQRNEWLIQHEGEQVQLFLRRWAGEICDCQKDTFFDVRCEKCYGVGFVGGYFGPYHFFMALEDSISDDLERDDSGYRSKASLSAWSIPFPLVRKGDLLVRNNGQRLVVGTVTNTTASGSIIQQSYSLESAHMGKFTVPTLNTPLIISKYQEHCPVERSISKKFQAITY